MRRAKAATPQVINILRGKKTAADIRFFCDSHFPLAFHLRWSPGSPVSASCWFQSQENFQFSQNRALNSADGGALYITMWSSLGDQGRKLTGRNFFANHLRIYGQCESSSELEELRMGSRNADFRDNHLPDLNHSRSLSASGSIRELGRYRSFLRLKAIGMVSGFRAKLEHSDIVQQTLLDAHQNLHQFRGRSGAEMAKWLSQILAHNVADAARALTRKKRDVRREHSLQNNVDGANIQPDQWLASEQTTPSLCVSRSEQLQSLNDAIQKLPKAQQEVIVLHHLQGRSLNETAELIGRSPPAVAGLLFRGLKTLRTLLAC